MREETGTSPQPQFLFPIAPYPYFWKSGIVESESVGTVEELLKRIQVLERRMDTLEDKALSPAMREENSAGTVSFQGEVSLRDATYAYAWERPSAHLTAGSWDEAMTHLAATAHPVRGRILQHLLQHPATVAGLVEKNIVSSTGTGYHHLAALQSAGWIHKDSQGMHSIKPKRVVALLTLILAMEEA